MTVAAIRGATTLDKDTRDQVIERTQELLRALMDENDLDAGALISMTFTATSDVTAEFPAFAAREMGLADVPLLCARELEIQGAVARCIRVLVHVETERPRRAVRHVYLRDAGNLRPDLNGDE